MKRSLCFIVMIMFLFSGCSWVEKWFGTGSEQTPDELISDGMYYYDDGSYRQAIESFQKLKEWYPFSKYASLAELKIADSYYHLGEYEDAVYAYKNFESLHPNNEAIPYVIFQIGTCYYEQMDTVDRDQTPARKALDTYTRLLRRFPDSDYSVKARQRIKECQKSLAGHEFYVGIFYYKNKKYKAALCRFKSVLANYPDVGIHRQALEYIANCRNYLKKEKIAQQAEQKKEAKANVQ